MKWIKASDRLPPINEDLLFSGGTLKSDTNFIKVNGSQMNGRFIKRPDGDVYFEFPSYDGHGNPYTLNKDGFYQIEWLDEGENDPGPIEEIDKFIVEDDLLKELELLYKSFDEKNLHGPANFIIGRIEQRKKYLITINSDNKTEIFKDGKLSGSQG